MFENNDEVNKAYEAGRCDVLTTDQSGLYSTRVKLGGNPDDHVVLPEVISKEPLGPAVRQGDDEWYDIVKWTLYRDDPGGGVRHHRGQRRAGEGARPRTPTSSASWA